MKEKIIISGPGASGKDFFASYLQELGLRKAKDFTTRPKRNETDTDYYYVTNIDSTKCFYEFKVDGRDWVYGYIIDELIQSDFTILPPSAINPAIEVLRSKKLPYRIIYFNIPEDVRISRLCNRRDGDCMRRIKTDREDFKDFIEKYNPHTVVTDPSFIPRKLL